MPTTMLLVSKMFSGISFAKTIEGRALFGGVQGGREAEREFELPDVVAAGDGPGGGG